MNRIDTRGKDEENKEKRKIRQEKVKNKKEQYDQNVLTVTINVTGINSSFFKKLLDCIETHLQIYFRQCKQNNAEMFKIHTYMLQANVEWKEMHSFVIRQNLILECKHLIKKIFNEFLRS